MVLGGSVSDRVPVQTALLTASLVHVGIGLWLYANATVMQAQSA
jgi:hypothetical protein